jgi:phage repressor protein C with HTH and peptisase S24 domain
VKKSVNQRIRQIIESKSLSVNAFANAIGVAQGTLASMLNRGTEPSNKTLNAVLSAFPEVNPDWLLTGSGEMYLSDTLSTTENKDVRLVPLLPVAAQGGTLNDFVVSVKASECEKIISPIRDVDYAMSISGDSMAPEYPSGAHILIKKINEKAFIDWGRVYVLDTCNGTVIKQLFPSDKPDTLLCKSINPNYPPFEVSFSDIYGVYRVLMCMSLK